MSDQISLYDVPHRAILALAFGMTDPAQVLRDFNFSDEQVTYLLASPDLERAVAEQRQQLERTGEMDQARVRMHAIAHMEYCTKAVAARALKEVDVKYLDVLFKGAGVGAKQAVQTDTGPRFSITFNLQPPKGRTIDGTATQVPSINVDLTALAQVALPAEEF